MSEGIYIIGHMDLMYRAREFVSSRLCLMRIL